jgi:DNA adenine methylase
MTDLQHEKLAKALHKVEGKVAISSYRCDLMNRLYADWKCVEAPEKKCHSVKKIRKEALWVNYEICGPKTKPKGIEKHF